MIYELRRYELEPANKAHFYERFERQFLPIASKYGLEIIGAWDVVDPGVCETVYLLAWQDHKTMQTMWDKVLADDEWIRIKKDSKAKYGNLVIATHSTVLNPTSYTVLRAPQS